MDRTANSMRRLSDDEVADAWARVYASWDFPAGSTWWFPLVETDSTGIVVFEAPAFRSALGEAWLSDVLRSMAGDRVFRLPEYTDLPATEEPLDGMLFRYSNPAEYFWCAPTGVCDWLVYASHEDSLTLAGDSLMQRAIAEWPEWRDHLWGNYPWAYRPAAT